MALESLADWAIFYAEQGIKVFPLAHKNSPVTSNGFHGGTLNAGIINDWWSREEWLIGGVIPKGVVILDTDGPEAEQALKAFDWSVPSTLTAKSRRGYHRWYRTQTNIGRKIAILPGVDLLTDGYVVLPPSKHAEGTYKWVGGEFSKNAISDAPEWLMAYEKAEAIDEVGLDGDRLLEGIPEGYRQTTLFRKACQLRGRGQLSKSESVVLIDAMAKASGFTEQTATYIVDRVWKNYPENEPQKDRKGKIWDISELVKSPMSRPKDLIEGMIPQGITGLISEPKAGKSFLAGQACYHIMTGKPLWGHKVQQSSILYLDLQQGTEYGRARWETLAEEEEIPKGNFVVYEWKRMDRGGIKEIEELLCQNPTIRLVVVDTLAEVYPSGSQSSGNAYYQEAVVINDLRKLYRDFGVSVLVVHHTTKATGKELTLKSISGSQAISGGFDGVLLLEGSNLDEGKFDGKLKIGGKNIPRGSELITFQPEKARWVKTKS